MKKHTRKALAGLLDSLSSKNHLLNCMIEAITQEDKDAAAGLLESASTDLKALGYNPDTAMTKALGEAWVGGGDLAAGLTLLACPSAKGSLQEMANNLLILIHHIDKEEEEEK